MVLHDDWRKILLRAWSTRWMVAAGVFGAMEIVLPMMSDEIPRAWFALGVVISITGGLIARISVQKEFQQ